MIRAAPEHNRTQYRNADGDQCNGQTPPPNHPDFFEMIGRLIELRGEAGFDGAALDGVVADILEIHANSVRPRGTTQGSAVGSPNSAQRGPPALRVVSENNNV